MQTFLQKYKHAWILAYLPIYFVWFFALEQRTNVPMRTIHTTLDDYIPFNEWFIIPYLLWFVYMVAVVAYFSFTSSEKIFIGQLLFLFIGMTICLIIYTFWPNCQNLRPVFFERDNILVSIVRKIYAADTSTNVCPSIHVFNSLVAHSAIMNSPCFKNKKHIRKGSFILMLLICLSTVFLKQHSIFDGICAFALYTVMYPFIYKIDYSNLFESRKKQEVVPKNIIKQN